MHKVVLDTNVIISGLIFPKSKPASLLDLVARGKLANFTSAFILTETTRNLILKFSWTEEEAESASLWLKTFSTLVNPGIRISVVSCEPDNRILECALESEANYIITGDHHLLDLKTYKGVKILTPAESLVEIF
jgi:putative PIN family toxin of toxin-antitoxin system